MVDAPGFAQLTESRLSLAEYAHQRWSVVPAEGTDFETVLRDSFWAHVSAKFKIGDIIEVRAEDGSYFAELYIRECGRNYAKTAVLRKVELEPASAPVESADFDIQWKGPHRKFAVVRLSDGEIMKEGFLDRAMAGDYLRSHSRAVAA